MDDVDGSRPIAERQDRARAQHPARTRVVLAATAGIFVEAFDWSMYGLIAPYLSVQMFPGSNTVAKLIGAYAVFAAAFLARPFGSAVMGRITDTCGRRAGLTYSVALIALGSLISQLHPAMRRSVCWHQE